MGRAGPVPSHSRVFCSARLQWELMKKEHEYQRLLQEALQSVERDAWVLRKARPIGEIIQSGQLRLEATLPPRCMPGQLFTGLCHHHTEQAGSQHPGRANSVSRKAGFSSLLIQICTSCPSLHNGETTSQKGRGVHQAQPPALGNPCSAIALAGKVSSDIVYFISNIFLQL